MYKNKKNIYSLENNYRKRHNFYVSDITYIITARYNFSCRNELKKKKILTS